MNSRTERKYFPNGRLPGEWYSEKDGHYHWEGINKDTGQKRKLNRKNLEDLRDRKEKILQAWENDSDADNFNKTINDVYPDYVEFISGKKLNTQSLYKRSYANHIENSIGKKRLIDIKPEDVVNYLNRLYFTQGLSKATAETIYIVLNGIYKTAKLKKIYTGTSPVIGSIREIYEHDKKLRASVQQEIVDGETPKVKDVVPHVFQKKEALSIDDVKNFAAAIKKYSLPFYPVYMVLLGTGVRISELAGLQWSDVDFENGTLTVSRTLTSVDIGDSGKNMKSRPVLSSTKNGKSRIVPLTPDVIEALKLQKELTKRIKRTEVCGLNDYIFITSNRGQLTGGKPFHKGMVAKKLKYLARTLEVYTGIKYPVFSPHIARHTFVTRLNEFGVPLDVVMYVVGHTPKEITERVYTHKEDSKRIREEMDKFYAKYSIEEGAK